MIALPCAAMQGPFFFTGYSLLLDSLSLAHAADRQPETLEALDFLARAGSVLGAAGIERPEAVLELLAATELAVVALPCSCPEPECARCTLAAALDLVVPVAQPIDGVEILEDLRPTAPADLPRPGPPAVAAGP